MSSELSCVLRYDANASRLYSKLREHVIVHDPPYNIRSVILPFLAHEGRSVNIIIQHSSRNVSVVENDIREHVLQTTVSAFQSHQLRLPTRQSSLFSLRMNSVPDAISYEPPLDSGKTCSICMEKIMRHELQCLPCAHVFHQACVGRWLHESATCPECRMELT